jgi:type I restriction enzyme S subunit
VLQIKLELPLLQTQKRIADILSAYDDLIENNLKRIKLLEQTAQNIYKEWFVNLRFLGHENAVINEETGLPVGWNQDFLDNQLDKARRIGKLKKDDYLEFGDFPIIDQSNGFIGGYSNDRKVVQFEPLPLVIFGDHTRRVKYVNFPFISGADGTQLLSPLNKNMLPAYFYLSIKSIDLSDYAYARHYKYLKQQTIIIPNDSILKLFNDKVCPMLEQGIKLLSYNTKLKAAREILLPRLMNRTIEV